ncbi:MAG TPA: hypothetical protein VFL84_00125 [Gammaproteobacteria bacterium]|nr:hypothetical protein [Gammaproteobacteria bacterium]
MRNKPLSTGWAIFWFAIASGVFFQLVSIRYGPDEEARVAEPIEVVVPSSLEEDVRAAQNLLAGDPDSALRHIERALERGNEASPELRALLQTWAANMQARRWHWHRARAALSSAVSLAPNDERRRALAATEEACRNRPIKSCSWRTRRRTRAPFPRCAGAAASATGRSRSSTSAAVVRGRRDRDRDVLAAA